MSLVVASEKERAQTSLRTGVEGFIEYGEESYNIEEVHGKAYRRR